MKHIIIVGGGAAGLAAGVKLVSEGARVTLFESKSFLGGRMFSFKDPVTGDIVDNGQHMMTGFYYDTLKLLSIIGSSDHLARGRTLEIDFVDIDKNYYKFHSPSIVSPLNFLWGLFRYKKFPKKDLWNLTKNKKRAEKHLSEDMSAYDYLCLLNQSEEAIKNFYRPLILATLNSELKDVSGILYRDMLNVMLKVPKHDQALVYSTVGLSDLLANPAEKFLLDNGVKIYKKNAIQDLVIEEGRIKAVVDKERVEHKADAFIFALPPDRLYWLLGGVSSVEVSEWRYSPIVSVNLWFKRDVLNHLMLGFLDSPFHWCFDKASIIKERSSHPYITLLISAAYREMNLKKDELVKLAISEMEKYFGVSPSELIHSQVIKEPNATVRLTPKLNQKRPIVKMNWDNAFLAGDWIDTSLPATIESAIKSGFTAAEMI